MTESFRRILTCVHSATPIPAYTNKKQRVRVRSPLPVRRDKFATASLLGRIIDCVVRAHFSDRLSTGAAAAAAHARHGNIQCAPRLCGVRVCVCRGDRISCCPNSPVLGYARQNDRYRTVRDRQKSDQRRRQR